jgi:NTE family protein
VIAAVLTSVSLLVAPAEPPSAASQPGVCLALSGGGARGLAHIGVLKALEEEGVRVRCIAGTSMGALVGGLYAAGYSPARMEEVVRSLEWQRVFSSRPERSLVPLAFRVDDTPAIFRFPLYGLRARLPAARDSDYRINRLLFQLLAEPGFRMGRDFDRYRVPLRTVATSLESGERVVLGSGSLARAVRASLSTPVNLVPVTVDGRLLVDGGLVDNLPTDVAREMGAGPVLAVDIRSTAMKPRPSDSFVDTTALVVDLLMRARNQQSFIPADLTLDLRAALAAVNQADYREHDDAIAIGYREGRRAVAEARTVLSAAGGPTPGVALAGPPLEGARIADVVVAAATRVRRSVVTRAFGMDPGAPFAMAEALRGMDAVYATQLFESVWLDVAPADSGGAVLTVEVHEAPRSVFEAGGGYDESDQARGFVRVRNRNLLGRGERIDSTALASGSEVGIFTGLTAERSLGLPFGFFVRGHVLEEKPLVPDGEVMIGRARFDRRGAAAGLQHTLGASGLLRVGAAASLVRTSESPGVPFPAGRDRRTFVLGEVAWDTLDDRAMPTEGIAASASAERTVSDPSLQPSYWRVLTRVQAARSSGARFVVRGQLLGATSGGGLPVHEQFRIGGPVFPPGLHRDAIWGDHALGGSLSVGFAVRDRMRAIGRVGAGHAWGGERSVRLGDFEAGVGVGLEMPTPLGPAILDWGRTFEGRSRLSLTLGLPREQSIIR